MGLASAVWVLLWCFLADRWSAQGGADAQANAPAAQWTSARRGAGPGSLVEPPRFLSFTRCQKNLKTNCYLCFFLRVLTQHKVRSPNVQRGKLQGKYRIKKLKDKDLSFLPALLCGSFWFLHNCMKRRARDERLCAGLAKSQSSVLGLRGSVSSLGE